MLRDQGLERLPIIAPVRLLAQPVAALLDRTVIYPVDGSAMSFINWGRGAGDASSARAADRAATALLARECRVLVIASATSEVLPSTATRGRAIYTTSETPMIGDRYRVWLLTAPVSERCPSGRR
jgi:hypothetical protein